MDGSRSWALTSGGDAAVATESNETPLLKRRTTRRAVLGGSLAYGHNHPRILEARRRFQDEKRHEICMAFMSQYTTALAHNLAAIAGVVLAAIYMLWAYQRTFHGPEPQGRRGLLDILPQEVAAVVPVVAVMLVLGVYPKVALDRINPSTEGVVTWVGSVAEGQDGLPGGLRAAIQDDYVSPPGSVATAADSAEEASP